MWAESHEKKWWHVPKKLKEKIQENQKTVKKGLHGQMIMYGEEGKNIKIVVLLKILNHIHFLENVMKSEKMKKSAHLCLRLGQIRELGNGGIAPMCLRQLRSKALREVWDIVPMGQWESACLSIRLGQSKGGIDPMCLRQLISKASREVWNTAPRGQ